MLEETVGNTIKNIAGKSANIPFHRPDVDFDPDLLKNEAMLDKVLLMFRPDGEHAAANRHAAEWMCPGGGSAVDAAIAAGLRPVSLRLIEGRPILAASRAANAAAGVLALRLHFKRA